MEIWAEFSLWTLKKEAIMPEFIEIRNEHDQRLYNRSFRLVDAWGEANRARQKLKDSGYFSENELKFYDARSLVSSSLADTPRLASQEYLINAATRAKNFYQRVAHSHGITIT